MRRGSTMFLKLIVLAIGLAVLVFSFSMLRAAVREENVGDYSPIMVGMAISTIPIFLALTQAMKLLHYIEKNNAFSSRSVKALKHIKYSALTFSALYILGMPYIYYRAEKDDAPGMIVLGLALIGISIVTATFAIVLQKLVQNGIDIKSENDLTV